MSMEPHFSIPSQASLAGSSPSPERGLQSSVSTDELYGTLYTSPLRQTYAIPTSSCFTSQATMNSGTTSDVATSTSVPGLPSLAGGLAPRKPPGKGKGTSHSRKKGEDHIPRPRNAFILFRCHVVANNLVPEELEKDHRNISRIISHMWNSLSELDRAVWQGEAQKEKDEHARMYPQYKYQPVYRKPVSAKRNVARPEGVEQQCERAADLIMKMCGDSGIARDGEKGPVSQSQKKKEQRRLRAQAKAAARSRQTSRARPVRSDSYSTTSDASLGHDGEEEVDSEMELFKDTKLFSRGSDFTSVAGDLATSVEPQFTIPQHHVSSTEQGMDSNPGMDIVQGVAQPAASSQDAQGRIWDQHLQRMQHNLANANNATMAFDEWESHLREGSLVGQYTLPGSHVPAGLAQRQMASSTRKAPPPPLLHTHTTPFYGGAIVGGPLYRQDFRHDQSMAGLTPSLSSMGQRPKSMETPTPRTLSFVMAQQGIPSHLTNDVALISPLRSGFRRSSATWQSWNAGLANDSQEHHHRTAAQRGHTKRPSYAGVPTPMQARPPPLSNTAFPSTIFDGQTSIIDEERLFNEAADEVAANYAASADNDRLLDSHQHHGSFDIGRATCGYGISLGSEEGVFRFAPDFLNGAHNELGYNTSPGSGMLINSYDRTSAGDAQELLSSPSPLSGSAPLNQDGLHHKASFHAERPSSSASGDSYSSAGSHQHRFVSVTSPTTARASSFSHDEIARRVGQRILGRWGQPQSPLEQQSLRSSLDVVSATADDQYRQDDDAVETLIDTEADSSNSSTARPAGQSPRFTRSGGSVGSNIHSFDSSGLQDTYQPRQCSSLSNGTTPAAWDLYGTDNVGQPIRISSLDGAFVDMLQQRQHLSSLGNDGAAVQPRAGIFAHHGEARQYASDIQTRNSEPDLRIQSSITEEGVGELFSPTLLRSSYSLGQCSSTTPDHSPSGLPTTSLRQQQQQQQQQQHLNQHRQTHQQQQVEHQQRSSASPSQFLNSHHGSVIEETMRLTPSYGTLPNTYSHQL